MNITNSKTLVGVATDRGTREAALKKKTQKNEKKRKQKKQEKEHEEKKQKPETQNPKGRTPPFRRLTCCFR